MDRSKPRKEPTHSGYSPRWGLSWNEFWSLKYNSEVNTYLHLRPANSGDLAAVHFKRLGTQQNPFWGNSSDICDGTWKFVSVAISNGEAKCYINGASESGSTEWFFPGKDTISGIALGRGFTTGSPRTTFDEATFSTVARSAAWISASYNNQKPDQSSNPYLNFETLVGPISLNDDEYTKIYGKKDTAITSYTVGHSGSGSFTATGLPTGLSINSATGIISGTTSVIGTQNVTITATGTTAGGGTVTVSKIYVVSITDPASFPYRMDLTLSGYTGSSTLTDFPVLVSLSSSISGFSYNGFWDGDGDGVRTGGDLRFFASSGQELAYEVADWNTSGTSDIWVKYPPFQVPVP